MWANETHVYPIIDTVHGRQHVVVAGCQIADQFDTTAGWYDVAEVEPVDGSDNALDGEAVISDDQLINAIVSVMFTLDDNGLDNELDVHVSPDDGLWLSHDWQTDKTDVEAASWCSCVASGITASFLDDSETDSVLITHNTMLITGDEPATDDPVLIAIISRLGDDQIDAY